MVTTRHSLAHGAVAPDENRVIAVVTGANSGFGLGICHQILSNLSQPAGTDIRATTPQRSALHTSQYHLLDTASSSKSTKHVPSPPPTLTLILACRSQAKAEQARTIILAQHDAELAERARRGEPVREGWREGLQVVWEGIDLDAVGGPKGVLQFCERLKRTYPHITSLFLNAGMLVPLANLYLKLLVDMVKDGLVATMTDPHMQTERPGVYSADGERGMMWGVNVLAPYILAKELLPLLQRSPSSLPFQPRIIYTSSTTAHLRYLRPNPLDDYQLLSYGFDFKHPVYKASKYFGDLVMVQLDRSFAKHASAGEREVRVFVADPGIAQTSLSDTVFSGWWWYIAILKWFYGFACVLARWFGSSKHPITPSDSALVMLYAAWVDGRYTLPAEKVPAQKFAVHSRRWGHALVDYGEVNRWEDTLDLGEGMVRACEAMRAEWRRREGLE